MAILFEMWVECADESGCRSIAAHFDGYQFTLLNGRIVTWEATVVGPPHYVVGVVVLSDVLSRAGVRSLQDALETTEAALRLYHHLKSAPAFRFARIDWEAENVPLEELPDYIETTAGGQCRLQIQCVIDQALYEQLGSPAFCYPFRNGYWWTRYRGEEYHPLYSNDQPQLNELCRAIFPEYFSC